MNRFAQRLLLQFTIVLVLLAASLPGFAQNPTIGLYADQTGNTCVFSGDAAGFVTAYVVFRPRADGATGVQFAGPIPECFGGLFAGASSQFLTIGQFTSDISIAFGSCLTEAANVLTVDYYRAGGQTAPCCEYPLVKANAQDSLYAVDCSFLEFYDVEGTTSYFNANVQCPCITLNAPPTAPSNPFPIDQATNAQHTPAMSWTASDVDGDLEEFDLYFGTSPDPPLLAPGLTTATYTPAPLAPLTQYYWRVVARDLADHETSGPVWTFTTRLANTPPLPPSNPSPADGQLGVLNLTLTWTGSDPDGDALAYDVYFGTTSPPPLVASNIAVTTYQARPLVLATPHYWRVVARDADDETSSPTWTFTTRMKGDVDGDGQLTLADADCALRLSVFDVFACAGFSFDIADVNCSQSVIGLWVTARDARCIHKQVVDGSCEFCSGLMAATTNQTLAPSLTVGPAFSAGNDEIGIYVYVSGVPSLEAFGFRLALDSNVDFVNALRFGVTSAFEGLASGPPPPLDTVFPPLVTGYTIGSVAANDVVGLVELRFRLTSGVVGHGTIEIGFDDLNGVSQVPFVLSPPPLAVLISRFEALSAGSGVEVKWEFSSDEPVATYTLYRRTGTEASVVIAEGDANRARSFVDRSVQPGTTYRYELVIRTEDGEEYRSPVKMVTTAELALSLRQNHPNPFNPTTTISFDIPGAGTTTVRLMIYDAAGRLVRTLANESMPGGSHSVEWNGRDGRGNVASSGVYFYVLDAGKERLTRKMVLLK